MKLKLLAAAVAGMVACGELVNGLASKTQTVYDNNTFECTFLQPEDIGSIGFYSFHTDGGRGRQGEGR